MDDKICPTNLLDDFPTSVDEFKTHNKLANTISEMINKEKGGKAIALVGDWGSGKSSVIEMLKKSCNNNMVFVYNTWSHEGDPLRRSFLEKIIMYFIDRDMVNPKKWNKNLKKLSSKIVEENVESKPVLNTRGKLFAICSLLMAIGLALISSGEYELNVNFPIFLSLSPIIFIIILFFQKTIMLLKDKNRIIKFLNDIMIKLHWISNEDKPENIFNFLSQSSTINVTTESIQTPNPTSIEFQDYYCKLLNEALKDNDDINLIIVMDNLDRIDPKEALDIWATMRTFLRFNHNSEWEKKVWLIVPFDEKSIKNLWKNNNDKNEFKNAFLDKTFQIKFHVSPPLLSRWNDYMIKLLKNALPKHSEEEFHDIYRLFTLINIKKEAPTPREIKIYINKVGAIHRQWQEEIPLKYMALYVSLDMENWIPEKDLLKTEYNIVENTPVLSIVGNDWREWLAAIHFNQEKEEAMQILLAPIFEGAILNNNIELLLEKSNIYGFFYIFEDYLEKNYNYNKEMICDSNIILIVKMLKNTNENSNKQGINKVWRFLSKYFIGTGKLDKLNKEICSCITEILRFNKDKNKFCKQIIKKISLTKYDNENAQNINISDWVDGICIVLKYIYNISSELCKDYNVPEDLNTYVSLIGNVSDDSKELHKFFTPKDLNLNSVIDHLSDMINKNKYNSIHYHALKVILAIDSNIDLNSFIQQLNSSLSNINNNKNLDTLKYKLLSVFLLKDKKSVLTKIKTLVNNGYFTHYFNLIFSSNDEETLSLLLFLILKYSPEMKFKSNQSGSVAGINKINNILTNSNNPNELQSKILFSYYKLAIKYLSFDEIISMGKNIESLKKLVTYIINNIINNQVNIIKLISEIKFINNYCFLDNILEKKQIIKLIDIYMSKTDAFINELLKSFDINLVNLYILVLDKDELPDMFIKFLKETLKDIDESIWIDQLENDKNMLMLLIKLNQRNISLELGNSLSDALLDHAKSILEIDDFKTKYIDEWEYILNSLDNSRKTVFLNKILDLITNIDENTNLINLLNLYGEEIHELKEITEYTRRIYTNLFPTIIDRKNLDEITWMFNFIEKNKVLLKEVDFAVELHANIIKNISLDNIDSDIKEKLISISKHLKMYIHKDIIVESATSDEES